MTTPFSPGEAIAAILRTHAATLSEGQTGPRVYPGVAPDDTPARPYHVWVVVSAGPEAETFGGAGTDTRYMVQVDTWADTAAEAESAAYELQDILSGRFYRDHRFGVADRVRVGYDSFRDGSAVRVDGLSNPIHNRSTDYILVPGR